jgi:flavin reductase (DIM6/NTAB) family NADH-FMN oxidoreductase RutF
VDSELVDAPYIAEFPLVLECKVLHTVEIGLHTEFIGEILDIKADKAVLREDGLPEMEKVRPIAYEPVNRRYTLGDPAVKRIGVGSSGDSDRASGSCRKRLDPTISILQHMPLH